MKSVVLLLGTLMMSAPSVYAQVPTDDVVNKWVNVALQTDEAKFAGSGRFTCTTVSGVSASDDSQNVADGKAVLLCIKKRCSGFQNEVNQYIDELRRKSPEERADIAAGVGVEDQTALIERVLRSGGYGGTTSCQVSMGARYLAYDSCVIGRSCSRTK